MLMETIDTMVHNLGQSVWTPDLCHQLEQASFDVLIYTGIAHKESDILSPHSPKDKPCSWQTTSNYGPFAAHTDYV